MAPIVFEKIIALERWDFVSQQVNHHIWRVYLTKLFGLMIVYFLNIYYVLLGKSSFDLFGNNDDFNFGLGYSCPAIDSQKIIGNSTSSMQSIDYTEYSLCREDQVLINLISQVIN